MLATITFIRNENGVMYPGCPNNFNGRMCQKKLADMGGGEYSCERCQKVSSDPALVHRTAWLSSVACRVAAAGKVVVGKVVVVGAATAEHP